MSKVTTFGGRFDTRGEVLRCWGNPGATAGVTSHDPKICGFYSTWSQVDVVVGSPFPLNKIDVSTMFLFCRIKDIGCLMHFKAI